MQAPFHQETTQRGKKPCLIFAQLKDPVSHSWVPLTVWQPQLSSHNCQKPLGSEQPRWILPHWSRLLLKVSFENKLWSPTMQAVENAKASPPRQTSSTKNLLMVKKSISALKNGLICTVKCTTRHWCTSSLHQLQANKALHLLVPSGIDHTVTWSPENRSFQ